MMIDVVSAENLAALSERLNEIDRETLHTSIPRVLVSEWAEENRVLTREVTQQPGPYSWSVNPFMREIVDNLSDSSPVREVALMKGAQMTATTAALENWVGYTIDVSPGPMLFVSADAGMADVAIQLRVDAMINTAGLASKIHAQHKRKGQRKTGDIAGRKEFPGGFLIAAGPRSGPKLRQTSFQKIAADEVDAFPQTTGKEGDPIGLLRGRVIAYTESYKILWMSTPLLRHSSHIERLVKEGDCRRYFVPCKHCGHMQYLRWHQLRFDYDDEYRLDYSSDKEGRITSSSVRYECEKCGGEWVNSDKDFLLADKPMGGLAEWRPSTVARQPRMRSYYLPSLYSPVGFLSWEEMVLRWLKIKADGTPRTELQSFVNLYLAETFEDGGIRPSIETLVASESQYNAGELPEGAKPVFLTLGADVQENRVECEIVAWGRDKESWSIDYHILPGDTLDLNAECWTALQEIIGAKHCELPITLAAIDSGYQTETVYQFCDSFVAGVHPVMGDDALARGRQYIKVAKLDEGRRAARIHINTDLLKQEIYRYLKMGERDGDHDKPLRGRCNFPAQYGRRYYQQLTAESRVLVESGGKARYMWTAGQRRNEALDCRVYALAMVYAYRDYVQQSRRLTDLSWNDFWTLLAPRPK